MRAARQVPAAAAALGVATARRRLGAFVASAAIGGLAGGLAVQLAGVADAGEYGPYLSFQLFVAVVIGGVASALGPAAGVAGLGARHRRRRRCSARSKASSRRASTRCSRRCSLLAVLALGGEGIVPLVRRLVARRGAARSRRAPTRVSAPRRAAREHAGRRSLVAESLTKRFGSVVAADAVSLELAPARSAR